MHTRAVQFLQRPLHASLFLCGIMKYHQVREIDEFRVSGDVFKYTHIAYLSVEQSQTIRLLSQNPSLIDNCGPETNTKHIRDSDREAWSDWQRIPIYNLLQQSTDDNVCIHL